MTTWVADNEIEYGEVCDYCVGVGVVEISEYEEDGIEYVSEMECRFCFGTGYEEGLN